MQRAVLCQARCVIAEGRLLADAVDQAVCPEVGKHGMQGGHGTEDGTRHGEADSIQQVLGLVPDALGAAGVGKIGLAHILHPIVQAECVPALVQTQADVHPDERQRAKQIGEGEGPGQRRMQL